MATSDLLDAGQMQVAREHESLPRHSPRGGVPVAYEVARRLGAPLDVLVVRKGKSVPGILDAEGFSRAVVGGHCLGANIAAAWNYYNAEPDAR